MANEKLVTLEQLGIVKTYVDTKDAESIKSAKYADNKISMYTTADKSGTPAIELDLPEEMFLDQAKTTFVGEFAWSEETYPGSTNPNLDGKPVLVLAVKGDTTVNYSFISIESVIKVYTGGSTNTSTVTVTGNTIKADVKISAEAGNTLKIKDDGLCVEPVDVPGSLTFATNKEVSDMFNIAAE